MSTYVTEKLSYVSYDITFCWLKTGWNVKLTNTGSRPLSLWEIMCIWNSNHIDRLLWLFVPPWSSPHVSLVHIKSLRKLVRYKLALPLGSQIHDVFHVSLLKKHLGPVTATSTQLPPVSDTSTVLPQPKVVLDRQVIHKGKYRPKSEILVKWVGVPAEDATWENEWRFTKLYPDFILVDKDP